MMRRSRKSSTRTLYCKVQVINLVLFVNSAISRIQLSFLLYHTNLDNNSYKVPEGDRVSLLHLLLCSK